MQYLRGNFLRCGALPRARNRLQLNFQLQLLTSLRLSTSASRVANLLNKLAHNIVYSVSFPPSFARVYPQTCILPRLSSENSGNSSGILTIFEICRRIKSNNSTATAYKPFPFERNGLPKEQSIVKLASLAPLLTYSRNGPPILE